MDNIKEKKLFLSNELEKIFEFEKNNPDSEDEWVDIAHVLKRWIAENQDIRLDDDTFKFLMHYLDSFDLRRDMQEYNEIQTKDILEIIGELKD